MFDIQKVRAEVSKVKDVCTREGWRPAGLTSGGEGGFDVSFTLGQVMLFSELQRDAFGQPCGHVWTVTTDAVQDDKFFGVKGGPFAGVDVVLAHMVRFLVTAIARYAELGNLVDVVNLSRSLDSVGSLLLAQGDAFSKAESTIRAELNATRYARVRGDKAR